MTSSAHFDDSQPTFNVTTLPLLAKDESPKPLQTVMDQTMAHLGLLRFQIFLKTLDDNWPEALAMMKVASRGQGTFGLEARFSCYHADTTTGEAGAQGANRIVEIMTPLTNDGFKPLCDLIDRVFHHGQRYVRREELAGLLVEAMDDKTQARLRSAALLEDLPQATAPSSAKPKF